MDAFPVMLEWVLDSTGAPTASGWDDTDPSVTVEQDAQCAICRCRVQNVREYKVQHVAWHNQVQPSAGITVAAIATKTRSA